MSPKSAERGYFIFNLILSKNEPQIGQRPIKRYIIYLNLILLKNEPQIGRRPIKGNFIFVFNFVEK
jgi:hypothetical protein